MLLSPYPCHFCGNLSIFLCTLTARNLRFLFSSLGAIINITSGTNAIHVSYSRQTLGNHEFDNGISGLVSPFLERVRFPVICCNLNMTRDPELRDLVANYTVLNLSGQLVGVIGYVTADTAFLVNPGKCVQIIRIQSYVSTPDQVSGMRFVNLIKLSN